MTTTRQPGFMTGLSLLFPITLSVMAALFIAPIAPKIGEAVGPTGAYSPATLGFLIPAIISVPSLCVALFSIPAGALGDRLGRRRLLTWAMAVYSAVGIVPFFLGNHLHQILASRVALGVVEAVLMTLSTTLIGDTFKGESRNRWLAAQTGVASLSSVVIVIVAGVIGKSDWHNVFLLYLVPILFLVLVLLFTWEPEESSHLAEEALQGRWGDLPWGKMLMICAITLFGGIMFYTVQMELQDALKAVGLVDATGAYDSAAGGLYIATASACVFLGTICFWVLSPRLPLKMMFLVEFLLLGAGFLSMSLAKSPVQLTMGACLDQIGGGLILPTLLTWAVSGLPFAVRGRGTGIWNATFAASQFACNVVALPAIMHFTGTLLPAIGVLGWLCLAAAAVALVTPSPAPKVA